MQLFTGATLAGGELAVRVDTGYPWSGAAEIQVARAPAGPAGLAVRVSASSLSVPCAERRAGGGRVRRPDRRGARDRGN